MTCPRKKLPDRRRNVTVSISHDGNGHKKPIRLSVSMGFADDRKLAEVFIKAGRARSDIDLIADDFAVLISELLQRGAKAVDLAHLVGRNAETGKPSTLAGRVLDCLVQHEATL